MPVFLINRLDSDITDVGPKHTAQATRVEQFTSADALREHLVSLGAPENTIHAAMKTIHESGNAIINIEDQHRMRR